MTTELFRDAEVGLRVGNGLGTWLGETPWTADVTGVPGIGTGGADLAVVDIGIAGGEGEPSTRGLLRDWIDSSFSESRGCPSCGMVLEVAVLLLGGGSLLMTGLLTPAGLLSSVLSMDKRSIFVEGKTNFFVGSPGGNYYETVTIKKHVDGKRELLQCSPPLTD